MSQRKRTTGATSSHATDDTTGKDSASSALPPPPAQGFRLKLLAAAALVGSATALYHFAGTAPLDTRMKPAVVGVAPAAHLHGTAASTAAATSTIHHLTTASGQPVYELDPNITTAVHAAGHIDWRSFIPQHPQPRFFDEQGAPKKKKSVDGKVVAVITPQQAVDEILTENQYSVGVSAGGVKARVDQTSVASNAPIEGMHSVMSGASKV